MEDGFYTPGSPQHKEILRKEKKIRKNAAKRARIKQAKMLAAAKKVQFPMIITLNRHD